MRRATVADKLAAARKLFAATDELAPSPCDAADALRRLDSQVSIRVHNGALETRAIHPGPADMSRILVALGILPNPSWRVLAAPWRHRCHRAVTRSCDVTEARS